MPDFSRPEYASYLETCREVAVDRKPQDGDYFVQVQGDHKPVVKGPILLPLWRVGPWPDVEEYGFSEFWLPTLADWLEMLEEAGQPDIGFLLLVSGWTAHESDRRYWPRGFPTREEAAGRLWVAVKS